MEFTPIPNVFLSRVLPQIDDIAELRATLHTFAAIYRKRGHPRFVTLSELLGDAGLMAGLRDEGQRPEDVLRRALDDAAERGTLIRLVLETDGGAEEVYFINGEAERRAVSQVRNGELALKGLKARGPAAAAIEQQPNVFALYEQNVGMLTPMIADELRDAEKLYPETWIRDAIGEAVKLNKRSWRYIARILERWATEGRNDDDQGRDAAKADPDKYVKGRYGHMVQR
jgi:DnaD/phage-associated family protein